MHELELENKINEIIDIHEFLVNQQSLNPSPVVNQYFSRLVDLVTSISPKDSVRILKDNRVASIIPSIQRLSSRGESALETFWVSDIISGQDPYEGIEKFPYYQNYLDMVDCESVLLSNYGLGSQDKILFVGSGPLPLSSIIMAQRYGFQIDNINLDESAVNLSLKLIEKLGLQKSLPVFTKNIFDIKDFNNYDFVIIAALVGKSVQEKMNIIKHIKCHTEKKIGIGIRSASDLATLLYPEVSALDLDFIELDGVYEHPKNIINNLIIGNI